MSKHVMTLEEMKARLASRAETSCCFQYCGELGPVVTVDNLQAAWDIVRSRNHPNFDSLDLIEFVMELEYEFDICLHEDDFEPLLDDDAYKGIDAIAERMIRYVHDNR